MRIVKKREEEIKVIPTFSPYGNATRVRHSGWKIALWKLRGERISIFFFFFFLDQKVEYIRLTSHKRQRNKSRDPFLSK